MLFSIPKGVKSKILLTKSDISLSLLSIFEEPNVSINIEVGFTSSSPLSVDTFEDLEKIRSMMSKN